ncbi:MAG: MarR family winged helix-turn-helix transcriptional regulator [Salinisphaera sp.]|jgi:MarR family transcriptional repressor of emrRAB|nr:MarR family winged helix-turn-helix transcriptional regulator [Salinisphaera sp.]
MNEPDNRLTNLFGALALGVTDRMRSAILEETTLGGETSAALVVVGHAPGQSINQLSRVLRLSHAGAVRMVARLTTAGLVTRSSAAHDRRVVVLHLTEAGQAQRTTLLDRRRRVLEQILEVVTVDDRAALERIIPAVLRLLPHDATSALSVCRFCNEEQCVACPMAGFGALDTPSGRVADE